MKVSRTGRNQKAKNRQRSKTPVKGSSEYEEYLAKLRLLEQIRLQKLKALEELCKSKKANQKPSTTKKSYRRGDRTPRMERTSTSRMAL
jgi:hypothetical protein